MSAYAYRIVNVFTQGRAVLSGNPLCVFERAQTLDAERMQALALQFNLSETTFILPSERASVRVRIFTPGYEMPFAGHRRAAAVGEHGQRAAHRAAELRCGGTACAGARRAPRAALERRRPQHGLRVCPRRRGTPGPLFLPARWQPPRGSRHGFGDRQS